ncbi:hypothetical protein [Romboutsia sp. MSSM.1001216sp_RTP31141st1_G3_RTP31141_220114]|uniref:hypothetical protein n=1 Tax=unclassified Romboutsia TaxID=2626894 RepID=UPI0031B56D24
MKKKKSQGCGCQPKCDNFNVCNDKVKSCKPCNSHKSNVCCKKPSKKYIDCDHESKCDFMDDCKCDEHFEITCVDKCLELVQKAEDLFDEASRCECKAKELMEKARECEKSSNVLAAKANDLREKAQCNENESRAAECKAKELMEKARELCEKAKCLHKEAEEIENEARCKCEKANDLRDRAQEFSEKAKCLYAKALKFDEKALECYKSAEDKIKEYGHKSKKCEEMIKKCSSKLDKCEMDMKKYIDCDHKKYCTCDTKESKSHYKKNKEKYCDIGLKQEYCKPHCKEDVYMDCDCATYVSPMYDMCNMHYIGDMADEYPMVGMPYMNACSNHCQDANDMWMHYYMNMKNMMKNMGWPRY